MEKNNEITPFVQKDVFGEGKEIRKVWHNEEWYFSVIDVIGFLTDSEKPSQYWHNMKKRDSHLSPICLKLKLRGQDGKNYPSDCANTEGALRIVMSVPSPKAEPLKLWLAQVGTERILETENPELTFERAREIYKAKGYPDDWIGYREKSIIARKLLTDEWKNRGVKEGQEYSILTATIAKQTFGLNPSEHAQLKGLEKQNLRDNMTLLELIFVALGEEVTRQVTMEDDAKGFHESHDAATKGGRMAGEARERLESQLKKPIVSSENFLKLNNDDKPNERLEGDKTK